MNWAGRRCGEDVLRVMTALMSEKVGRVTLSSKVDGLEIKDPRKYACSEFDQGLTRMDDLDHAI